MIRYSQTDITAALRGIIAHGCNTSGGFGSGVAGAIRAKWPHVYQAFMKNVIHKDHRHEQLGLVQYVVIDDNLMVANCYTQLNFGNDGQKYASPDAIYKSLRRCIEFIGESDMPLHIPKIGSGLGGLSWETDVLPLIEQLNDEYPDVDIIVHSI